MKYPVIENWFVSDVSGPHTPPEHRSIVVCGEVHGHKSRPDGDKIQTSRIQSIRGKVIATLNSKYRLGTVKKDYLDWMKEKGIEFNPDKPIRVKKVE